MNYQNNNQKGNEIENLMQLLHEVTSHRPAEEANVAPKHIESENKKSDVDQLNSSSDQMNTYLNANQEEKTEESISYENNRTIANIMRDVLGNDFKSETSFSENQDPTEANVESATTPLIVDDSVKNQESQGEHVEVDGIGLPPRSSTHTYEKTAYSFKLSNPFIRFVSVVTFVAIVVILLFIFQPIDGFLSFINLNHLNESVEISQFFKDNYFTLYR